MMEDTRQGGLRLRNISPLKQPGLPVVSIITVVYNGLDLIEKTIQNVISQRYPNIEYIVIDGCSTDGTTEVIRVYEEQISYWISEPDKGIYDAMNKGLAAATGDFVWFMNAGDLIYAADTLEKVFQNNPGGLLYYGDTMVVDSGYREVGLRRLRPPEVLTWKSFRRGMLVCHQAILVSKGIAEPFDLQYRHSADFDWVLRALQRAEGSIVNTHQVLCAFLDGGHSKQNIRVSLEERFHSMSRHYGFIPTAIRHIPIALRFGWYFLRNKRF